METINKKAFDQTMVQRARLFKALGHPARLAILEYLASIKTCITGDIAEELPLSRTTVNQHLKVLKEAGLIKGNIDGVKTNYCLNAEAIAKLRQESGMLFSKIDCKKSYC